MCERVWKKVQDCALSKGLATRSRGLQVAKGCTRVKHADELNSHASWSTTWRKVQSSHSVSSRLGLVTQSSHEAKSRVHSIWEKLTLRIPNTHQYKYPLYPQHVESFQREFWEKDLEKNKIDSSTIFTYWFSKFLNSHPLHYYILERYINQNLFSPYPYLWGGHLVLGKWLERDQLILADAMGYSGIR